MNNLIIYVLHFTIFTHNAGTHEITNPKPAYAVFDKESVCNETGKKIIQEVFLYNPQASNYETMETATFYCTKQTITKDVPENL